MIPLKETLGAKNIAWKKSRLIGGERGQKDRSRSFAPSLPSWA